MPSTPITTPKFLRLEIAATADRPSVRIRVMHNEATGAYVTANLELEHPRVAVTPTLIAKMGLGGLRREALRKKLSEENAELARRAPVKTYFRGSTGRAVSEKARNEPTDEHLENAAIVYRLARLVGDFPVQTIARVFALDRADAQRWVKSLRKNGALS